MRMKTLTILTLASTMLCAGCSRNLSRTEAAKQIGNSTDVRIGAYEIKTVGLGDKTTAVDRKIGSVVNVSVMEIFTDGPRARARFSYEIELDKAQDSSLFPDGKEALNVWVGSYHAGIFTIMEPGIYEKFGSANFEKTDDGWTLRTVNMDSTD